MPGPYREAAELMRACPEGPPGGSRPSPTNRRERVPYGERHTVPHTSARRGRACPARRCAADGRLRETCGPGMPGPYRETARWMQVCPEGPPGGSRPSPTNRRERVPYGEMHTVPHTSARRGRACPARRCTADGCLREACGPGMPGPYREPKTKTSRPNRRDGSFLCE